MTPAQRLLTAADLLDKRASDATEGPWILAKHKDGRILGIDAHDGYDEVVTTGDVSCMSHCYGGASTIEAKAEDWRYIATMHPEVGKALAKVLRSYAEWVRGLEQILPLGSAPESDLLTLADLVLAGES